MFDLFAGLLLAWPVSELGMGVEEACSRDIHMHHAPHSASLGCGDDAGGGMESKQSSQEQGNAGNTLENVDLQPEDAVAKRLQILGGALACLGDYKKLWGSSKTLKKRTLDALMQDTLLTISFQGGSISKELGCVVYM